MLYQGNLALYLNKSLSRDKVRIRDLRVHSFVKAEQYPGFKMPRSINGRVDYSKIIFGPLIKSVELIVYKHPAFIKNIPLPDRPKYISDNVAGPGLYYATDHTSFESSFTPALCLAVEYEVYSHILNPYLANLICVSFYTLNTCVFKFFRLHVVAKRMSGDMNTSLGNGITNLITILFLVHQKTKKVITSIVVEGDDSLFRLSTNLLTTEDFASVGLNTKIDIHYDLHLATFCGAIYDPQDMKNLVDPGRILRRFGYIDPKYLDARHSIKMGLLRAYALSIYYQYNGCPIVESLARYLLRVTRGYFAKINSLNQYKYLLDDIPTNETTAFRRFPPYQIGIGSRTIIHAQFGLSYDDQIACENYLDKLNVLQPIDLPIIVSTSPRDCVEYFETCAAYEGDDIPRLQHPPFGVKFYWLVDQLKSRFVHLNNRHDLTSWHELPYGAPGFYCSCGDTCNYWEDLLYGLRPLLHLKPSPPDSVPCRSHKFSDVDKLIQL